MTQEVHVFAGPLAADLRLAQPDATDAELETALARVGALAWVLLVDPPMVLLDEATAEAGSTGARELEAAAAEVLRGRTALVVAHRLTQAATADRIVVFDHGRVVERGTHDDLATRDGGTYARLWQAWSTTRDTPAPIAGG